MINRLGSNLANGVKSAPLLVFCLACVGVVGVLWRGEMITLPHAILAIVIFYIGIIPGLAYLGQDPGKRAVFPLMSLAGLFYSVFFGLSGLFSFVLIGSGDRGVLDPEIAFYDRSYLTEISFHAQCLAVIGVVLMLAVWAIVRDFTQNKISGFSFSNKSPAYVIIWLAWSLAIANLAYVWSPEIRTLPSVGQFLQPSGYVACALFLSLPAKGRVPTIHKRCYFLVTLPIWVIGTLSGGFMTPVILMLVLCLALNLGVKQYFPWKLIIAISLIFFIIYPHVNFYRAVHWHTQSEGFALSGTSSFFELARKNILMGNFKLEEHNPNSVRLVRRVSHILPLSYVAETTPETVPFWNGATYRTLFLGWIPRFLWSDKPEERWGNEFGRRYGILAESNRTMSINIPWLTEMYANFGTKGVLLGMVLVGMFLGLLDSIFNNRRAALADNAIGAGLLLPLFYQESNFTVMTGTLPLQFLCFWLFFFSGAYCLKKLFREPTKK